MHGTKYSHGIQLTLMNAQTVRNKTPAINEYIFVTTVDLLVITETWLKRDGDSDIIKELAPEG